MKSLSCLALLLAAILSLPVSAQQSGINNPVTKAVLSVYAKQLSENPKDYSTWFKRANEYYRHNEYALALDDVNKALELTPTKEATTRYDEYMLRASIYTQLDRQSDALADLNSALIITPDSYSAIYQRANVNLELGKYSDAKRDFTRLQGLNSRSTEALIGLARVAVKENNLGMANDYLAEAVNLDPNNAYIYVRRASVRKLMQDHNAAVSDLILALSCDENNARALNELVEYGNTNYVATMNGLSNAIAQAPNVAMYIYLRAVIAQTHYNYTAAITDYQKIINDRMYSYHGLYASIAECLYALGRYEDALLNIDTALGMTADEPNYFVLRARIQRALGRIDDAINSVSKCLAVNRDNNDALIELALGYIAKANYSEASTLLGEACLNDASNTVPLLLRAYVLQRYLNQPSTAKQYFTDVVDVANQKETNMQSLKGFAMLSLERIAEANNWIECILTSQSDNDGLIHYYGACFYAQAGDTDKALACAEKSLSKGYANYHNWQDCTDGMVNVAPLRSNQRFVELLNKYDVIFGR